MQFRFARLPRLRGGLRHFKMVEHGQQFQQKRDIGRLNGLAALAGGAFFKIIEIGGGAQEASNARRPWRRES